MAGITEQVCDVFLTLLAKSGRSTLVKMIELAGGQKGGLAGQLLKY